MSECVDRLETTLKFWTEENWNCAVFYQHSTSFSWRYSYYATSRFYPIHGMCGKPYSSINTGRFQNSCKYAGDRCGSDVNCAKTNIQNLQSSTNSNTINTYRFCNNNSHYNMLITRQDGLVAHQGYSTTYSYAYKNFKCTAYCSYPTA